MVKVLKNYKFWLFWNNFHKQIIRNIPSTLVTNKSVLIISENFHPKLRADTFDPRLNNLCFEKADSVGWLKKIKLSNIKRSLTP